ncbi:MAG: DUF4256 domain-containing protein [Candidatus Promineifilaceae bacterium]
MKKSSKKLERYVPNPNRTLSPAQREELLSAVRNRFADNMSRHEGLEWADIETKLEANPEKLWSLNEMERTGGEPDVFGRDPQTAEYLFFDSSAESPAGRRSICYDQAGQAEREKKKVFPAGSAVGMAQSMGIELLTEDQYRALQESGEFDLKTSSWVQTPAEIRALGGAIFCDRRYGQVFTYHNGASSFYSARGFRGLLRV